MDPLLFHLYDTHGEESYAKGGTILFLVLRLRCRLHGVSSSRLLANSSTAANSLLTSDSGSADDLRRRRLVVVVVVVVVVLSSSAASAASAKSLAATTASAAPKTAAYRRLGRLNRLAAALCKAAAAGTFLNKTCSCTTLMTCSARRRARSVASWGRVCVSKPRKWAWAGQLAKVRMAVAA